MKQFISAFFLALALTGFKPTSASIVYTNINDTTIQVYANPGSSNYYNLDVNNDGTIDFKIEVKCYESWEGYHPPHNAYKITIRRMNGNQIAVGPFLTNDRISTTLDFCNKSDIYGYIPGIGIIGMWAYRIKKQRDTFLGLKINDNGNDYYGWVNLKISHNSFTICSYAYNNVSDASILAGQTN